MYHVGSYFWPVEVGMDEVRVEKRVAGTLLKGSSRVIYVRGREVEVHGAFYYNGRHVMNMSTFCDLVDPAEEWKDTLNHYGLVQGEAAASGELMVNVKITENSFALIDDGTIGDSRYYLPYSNDHTIALREANKHREHIALDGVCWSSKMPEQLNAPRLQAARNILFAGKQQISECMCDLIEISENAQSFPIGSYKSYLP